MPDVLEIHLAGHVVIVVIAIGAILVGRVEFVHVNRRRNRQKSVSHNAKQRRKKASSAVVPQKKEKSIVGNI